MSLTPNISFNDMLRYIKGLECSILTEQKNIFPDFRYIKRPPPNETNEAKTHREHNLAERRKTCNSVRNKPGCIRTPHCRDRTSSKGQFTCELMDDIDEISVGEKYSTTYGEMLVLEEIKSVGSPTIFAIQATDTLAVYITFPCLSLQLFPTLDDTFNIEANLQELTVDNVGISAGLYSIFLRFNKVKDWIMGYGRPNPDEPNAPPRKICICGFSLGGSLARIMAFRIQQEVYKARLIDPNFKFGEVFLYISGEIRSGGDSWLKYWQEQENKEDRVIRKVVSIALGVTEKSSNIFCLDPRMYGKERFNGQENPKPLRTIPPKLILDMITHRPPLETLKIHDNYNTGHYIEEEIHKKLSKLVDDKCILEVEPYKSILSWPSVKPEINHTLTSRMNSVLGKVHKLDVYRKSAHEYMVFVHSEEKKQREEEQKRRLAGGGSGSSGSSPKRQRINGGGGHTLKRISLKR